jgi:hypothetical protein
MIAPVIVEHRNTRGQISVTSTVAASKGKKTEEEMTMSTSEHFSSSVAVADLPQAQTVTLATTEQASDILTTCKIESEEATKN